MRKPGKHFTVVSDDRSIRLAMLAQDRLAPMGSKGAAPALRWLMPAHPTGGRLRFSTAAAVSPYRFSRLPRHHPQRIIRIRYYIHVPVMCVTDHLKSRNNWQHATRFRRSP